MIWILRCDFKDKLKICLLEVVKIIETESRVLVAVAVGGMELLSNGCRVLVLQYEKSYRGGWQ